MTDRLGRWVLVVAAAVALSGGLSGLAALRAAGLNGTAPAGAGGVQAAGLDVDEQLGVVDRDRGGSGPGADRWVDDRRLGTRA